MTTDALKAAHDLGYLHGLIAGALLTVVTALMAAFAGFAFTIAHEESQLRKASHPHHLRAIK